MSEFEYVTDNGVNVKINPCEFKDAGKLKNIVIKELKSSGANFGELMSQNMEQMSNGQFDSIAQIILSVASSPELEQFLFPCLLRSTYDDTKITPETFNDLDARGEYFKIVALCLKLNVFPFFKNLGCLLSMVMN